MDIDSKPPRQYTHKSTSLPFGQDVALKSIGGQSYLTAQTLVQQVAYTLSDKIFTYSPETFDLDIALKSWKDDGETNAFEYVPGVVAMETRAGAGSIALGYVFSRDFDLKKRHIPQAIVASSASLNYLRPSLDQLSLLHDLTSPFVAHVAAVDSTSEGLVTDYLSSLAIADDLGLGLITSTSADEVQHMSLLATLLAKVVPTIHTFDGVHTARETQRLSGTLDQKKLTSTYNAVAKALSATEVKHSDSEGKLIQLLNAFNKSLKTTYAPFEYVGHEKADHVLVVFGTLEASISSHVVEKLSSEGAKVGVINVRVYRPFVEEEFIKALPKSVKSIAVLGQVEDELAVADENASSLLYKDVLAALTFSSFTSKKLTIHDSKYAKSKVWSPTAIFEVFKKFVGAKKLGEFVDLGTFDDNTQQSTFWSLGDSPAATAPLVLGELLSTFSNSHVTVRTTHDNLIQGGVVRTDIRSSQKSTKGAHATPSADVVFVSGEQLLGEFDPLNSLKAGGAFVISLPGFKDEQLEKKLPVGLRQGIVGKDVKLYILDPTQSSKVAENADLESTLIQLVYLKLAGYLGSAKVLEKLSAITGDLNSINALAADIDTVLKPIEVPESWATIEPEVEKISLPTEVSINSFAKFERIDPNPPNQLEDWTSVAKGLLFKEAYGTKSALRPDLAVKTAVVHVKERRRLTPLAYDRNIFHIEFDLGTSGVTYAIGEALGIHAENDPVEVEKFIKWYGLNANEIVQVPSREDPNILENRTVYQALLQNIDIFGRPGKKFYEALAEFSSDPKEKRALLAPSTPEGNTDFKRRAEVDFVTFADLLLEFPSAHPSFHEIVRMVPPMKRREYSIASSQHVTPTSVSLLIVTVEWVDSGKRDRFGQATRYLNSLPIGAPVTVSVKPSVMKLPPKTTAPIIMAGLGTGLAPFRAFVQERAYQKQQGHEIGAVMLYMGSRHQKEEYLYGEEWEAYRDAGIITHMGCAFSRDQPEKIYIQDRMRQSMGEVRKAYFNEEGSFYLCGPTWPVPDVTEVLQESWEAEERGKGAKKVDGRRAIEELKDQGRYVLEVY
jgi:sulfite reductase (NADPH) flavoprotein alpha-component